MTLLSMALMCIGLFFLAVSAIGLVRLPDFFTRVHAVSKSETLGISLILLGLILLGGFNLTSLKMALVLVFVFLTNPLGAHLLTRAAVRTGTLPWRRREKDVMARPTQRQAEAQGEARKGGA